MSMEAEAVDLVVSRLRSRERLFRVKVAAMILFGLPLSLVGPLVLATVFWFAGWRLMGWTSADSLWARWPTMFWMAVVLVVPLLYRLEIRTQGKYLSEAMSDANAYGPRGTPLIPNPAGAVVAIAAMAASPRASSAGIVEVFLFGPRLVVDAVRQIKSTKYLRGADRQRGADMLLTLRSQDQGMASAALLRESEQLNDVLPTMAYLVFFRWVGVRDECRHVWLMPEARRVLRAADTST